MPIIIYETRRHLRWCSIDHLSLVAIQKCIENHCFINIKCVQEVWSLVAIFSLILVWVSKCCHLWEGLLQMFSWRPRPILFTIHCFRESDKSASLLYFMFVCVCVCDLFIYIVTSDRDGAGNFNFFLFVLLFFATNFKMTLDDPYLVLSPSDRPCRPFSFSKMIPLACPHST